MVEPHIHDGNSNAIFSPTVLQAANLYYGQAIITLSSAQILALHTTPQILIPAAGINQSIIVEGIGAKINYNATTYTGSNNLEFRSGGGGGTKVTADIPASSFLDSTFTFYYYAPAVTSAFAPDLGQPIVVSVPTANPAAGNSSITFTINYHLINF